MDIRRLVIRRCLVAGSLVVAGAWLGGSAAAQEPSTRQQEGLRNNAPDRFALINARIVIAPGRILERGTVLIDGRQIVEVSESATPPIDAQTIDLTGLTLYPGLIDAYTEVEADTDASQSGAAYWNANIQPQRDLSRAQLVDQKLNDQLRRSGITLRLVAPAGGILKGQSCLLLTLDDEMNEALLKSRVAQHASLTVPFRRPGEGERYPNSPMGATALARQAMYDAVWYAEAWRIARDNPTVAPPEHNLGLEALQPVLQSRQPMVVDCGNEIFALRADRFAREFGAAVILRGSGKEYQRMDDVAALRRPILLPVDFPKPPPVGSRDGAINASLDALMHWDIAPENPARLARAGVLFAFGSFPLKKTDEFLQNIRRAVHRGLDSQAALAALTTAPAEILGVPSLVGTLEKGKLANLVAVRGDLFSPDAEIVETWVAGRRSIIGTNDFARVAGTWTFPLAGGVSPQNLVIERGDEGFSGSLKPAPEEPKTNPPADEGPDTEKKSGDDSPSRDVKSLVVQGNRVSGSVDGRHWGRDGWVQFSLIIVGDDATGQATFADATAESFGAQRVAPENAEDSPAEPKESGDSEIADSEDQPDGKKGKRKRTGVDFEKDLPATYSVNYPLGAYGLASAPDQPERIAFRGATIWTCGPMGLVENATLIVGQGRVIAVQAGNVPVPANIPVVDVTGSHITPGIIDCHSHMATDGGVNESGQAITAEVRIGDFIDCHDITIYRQLAGGVTAANILHGSANPIGGQNQVIKLRWGANDEQLKFGGAPEGIKFALGENVKQSNRDGNDRSRYPQTRMGVEQIIDDEFRAARDYRRLQDEWKAGRKGLPPRTDLELEAMAEILEGRRWVHCHSYRQDEILALIRILDQHNVQIGSFQHILEGYKVAEKMAEHGATASAFADWWAYKFEVYDAIPYAGALMHQAGLVVSFNSDDAELGRHLNHEAAKAVRFGGVEPTEALKFVTLNPARQLRIDSAVGSLEPGKHADFVVWNGDPLSNFSRAEQTWIDGRKYFDLQEDLARQIQNAEMHRVLVQKALASGQDPADESELLDESGLWPRYDEFCHGHDVHDHDAHE